MARTGARRGPPPPTPPPTGRGAGGGGRAAGSSVATEVAQRRSATSAARWIGGLSVLIMLSFLLGPTLKTYIDQRRAIADLQEQVTAQRADVAAKEQEKKLWADDTYVVQQARQRLKFVKVGEQAYEIIDLETAAPAATDPARPQAASRHAWYGQVWESIKVADNPQQLAR